MALSSETWSDSTMLTTTISSTTTEHPFRPLYRCNFTTPCFGKGQLGITNGTEFDPTILSNISDPPRAPTSGVTSISKCYFSSHKHLHEYCRSTHK
jgi:hypothetical protein